MNMNKSALMPILSALRQELQHVLGDRFEAAYLYGSRARGEACPDSDVDVLVVVRGPFDYGDLIQRTSALISNLSLEYETVISRAFVSRDRFEHEESPFLLNVRKEAVPV
jgi:predicted nucleotidyltransferase